MKVNQNIAAVISNTQLLRTEDKLTAAIERLSSGLRINNAKDDPAGLAISNKMKQQIDGIEQAGRNTQDGTSALNTADGALNEVVSIIQRMHELAVQAANGTNTTEDRQSSQDEIIALRKEVDRISQDTEFNTKRMLDGTLDARVYAGKGVERIYVSDYVTTGDYKLKVNAVATKAEVTRDDLVSEIQGKLGTGKTLTLDINGVTATFDENDTADTIKSAILQTATNAGAEAEFTADNKVKFTSNTAGSAGQLDISYTVSETGKDDVEVKITDRPVFGKDANGIELLENFGAMATVVTEGTQEGTRVKITDQGGFYMDFLLGSGFAAGEVDFKVTDIGTLNIQSGANEAQQIRVRIPEISADSLYLDEVDLTTADGAMRALDTLDEALARTSEVRSKIGAYTNRMEHANASLGQTDEDLTSAFSRIKDIDMATEMVEYANQQVLQQAATSVLSQANDIPQQVLQLLNS